MDMMESFWSTSVMKKKKFRFGVELRVAGLSNYAPMNGVLFTKIRLEERTNGDFEDSTERVSVSNHKAVWNQTFNFTCKLYAKPNVGVLEECPLRISVRKDGKAGKTEKLGFTTVNISEFAGVGIKERRCLLQSYDTNNFKGQDNSILAISLNVTLLQGDPVFLRPESSSPSHTTDDPELRERSFAGSTAAASVRTAGVPSPASVTTTPRRPPQIIQNFLSRRATLMSNFMRDTKPTTEISEETRYGHGDGISIGSNDLLAAELLDPDGAALVAQASSATILADDVDSSVMSPSSISTITTMDSPTTPVPAITVHPTSVISLDSGLESTCSSTALHHSMNSDRLSLSSTANSSLRFSSPDLHEPSDGRGEVKKLERSKLELEPSDSSCSGSTSAPATVRRKHSVRHDTQGIDDIRFNSLETSSRQSRMRKASRAALGNSTASIKSSGRSSVMSQRDSITSVKLNLESTRVDSNELIESLMCRSSEDVSKKGEESSPVGLQLYIGPNGSTEVGGKTLHDRPASASHYRKVVMDT